MYIQCCICRRRSWFCRGIRAGVIGCQADSTERPAAQNLCNDDWQVGLERLTTNILVRRKCTRSYTLIPTSKDENLIGLSAGWFVSQTERDGEQSRGEGSTRRLETFKRCRIFWGRAACKVWQQGRARRVAVSRRLLEAFEGICHSGEGSEGAGYDQGDRGIRCKVWSQEPQVGLECCQGDISRWAHTHPSNMRRRKSKKDAWFAQLTLGSEKFRCDRCLQFGNHVVCVEKETHDIIHASVTLLKRTVLSTCAMIDVCFLIFPQGEWHSVNTRRI